MSDKLDEREEADKKDHKPHPVSIKVNNRDVTVPDRDVTGGQIKQAADVPATFQLFGPKGDEVENDQRVRVHKNERFTAISGQDVS